MGSCLSGGMVTSAWPCGRGPGPPGHDHEDVTMPPYAVHGWKRMGGGTGGYAKTSGPRYAPVFPRHECATRKPEVTVPYRQELADAIRSLLPPGFFPTSRSAATPTGRPSA